jgi:uncharacterized protein
MRIATISKLCCPFDKNDLDLQIISKDTSDSILEGLLTCRECNRYYPIVKGIPIMNPDEYRENKFELPLITGWSELTGRKTDNFRFLPANSDEH